MTSSAAGALDAIFNFRSLGPRLATAGQPTVPQFRVIRDAGFQAVINLALPTSDNAIADEGSLVAGLEMIYLHVPVDFQAPKPGDFQTFCRVLEALEDRPVFVHCAANMRVSAFVFLYRVLRKGVSIQDAERDLHAIWEPDEVWTRFIQSQLAAGAGTSSALSEAESCRISAPGDSAPVP